MSAERLPDVCRVLYFDCEVCGLTLGHMTIREPMWPEAIEHNRELARAHHEPVCPGPRVKLYVEALKARIR